ncbi:MAG: class I SAM-dependent methyltransferase [Sphingopyxis sp.]
MGDGGAQPGGTSAAARRIARLIEQDGSVPISLFIAYANAHYYATRDPLGAAGDFTTAPEISQMFGELIGLWCADIWMRAGAPADCAWVEFGPGRGTLAADAARSMARFGFTPTVHLVETSPVLRDLQAVAMPRAHFHDDASTLPADRPLIIIANEFFDALPIRQIIRTAQGWRERVVVRAGDALAPAAGHVPMDAAVPAAMMAQPIGAIIETCPLGCAIAQDMAGVLARQGGAMLAIDYGHATTAVGDTLQAMARHAYADIFADIGNQDLTAHVDFGALGAAARRGGARVNGPVGQGAFLNALGLAARADALAAGHPARASGIAAQRARLAGDDAMGALFKAMAFSAPQWPIPEGFGA